MDELARIGNERVRIQARDGDQALVQWLDRPWLNGGVKEWKEGDVVIERVVWDRIPQWDWVPAIVVMPIWEKDKIAIS